MTFKKLIGLLPLDEYISVYNYSNGDPIYQGRLEDLDFKTWIHIKLLEVYEFFAIERHIDNKVTPAIFITVKK
jgi:hypothetical protein